MVKRCSTLVPRATTPKSCVVCSNMALAHSWDLAAEHSSSTATRDTAPRTVLVDGIILPSNRGTQGRLLRSGRHDESDAEGGRRSQGGNRRRVFRQYRIAAQQCQDWLLTEEPFAMCGSGVEETCCNQLVESVLREAARFTRQARRGRRFLSIFRPRMGLSGDAVRCILAPQRYARR